MVPKILAFAGSTRAGSYNKKLIAVGAAAARAAGAEVTLIDLRDFPMPLYDGDLEEKEGVPPHGKRLKELMKSHQGFLLSCPEYNSSIPGVLKNAIDWASRKEGEEPDLVCFRGKTAALLSASPGALGRLRGLVTVRSILGNIGALVLPGQVAAPKADQSFQPDGTLKDAKQQASVERVTRSLATLLQKLQ